MSSRQEQEIEDLQGEIAKRDARIVELKEEVLVERDSVQGYLGRINRLRAELAAIKAQEPVGFADITLRSFAKYKSAMHCLPLYAAPVSEAKAQGVVQWPEADEIMQMAFEEGHPADDASGYYFELEEFDLFIDRLMSEVARLNAAPVQQVSVPDVSAMARVLADRHAENCNVNKDDNWKIYGQDYIDDVNAMLAAAPAHGDN